jgi:thioredoxin reductase (NADPH)
MQGVQRRFVNRPCGIGGGNAALEAAVAISEQPGATVALSYRGNAFNRVKPKNRERMEKASASGQLRLLLESNVKQILSSTVQLDQKGTGIELPNDAVIVCAGEILPTPLLKEIGIHIETRHGTGNYKQMSNAAKPADR